MRVCEQCSRPHMQHEGEDHMKLTELIEKMIAQRLESVWTCAPATVVKVNSGLYTCDILPKAKLGELDAPILTDVPIIAMKGGASMIIMPVAVGDVVLAMFSKYSLDNLLKDSSTAEHGDTRRFSIDDAMVLPGIMTSIEPLPAVAGAADEMLIYHQSGGYMKFDAAGNLTINAKTINFTQL